METHIAKYVLDAAHERDHLTQHVQRMYFAILAFRKLKLLRKSDYAYIRATNEYHEMCNAWKAYDVEINSMSHKDMLAELIHREDTGWHS